MNFAQIRKYDVANGTGIRTVIFVTGCTHNCRNCFNKEYQDFNYGEVWTEAETEKVIEFLKDDNVSGLTLLGGEPMQNLELIQVLKAVKDKVEKPIWVYSGYTYEEIMENEKRTELLKLCDVLVDGRFVEDLKDLKLKFRGSSNQRIIDVKKSMEQGKVVLFME